MHKTYQNNSFDSIDTWVSEAHLIRTNHDPCICTQSRHSVRPFLVWRRFCIADQGGKPGNGGLPHGPGQFLAGCRTGFRGHHRYCQGQIPVFPQLQTKSVQNPCPGATQVVGIFQAWLFYFPGSDGCCRGHAFAPVTRQLWLFAGCRVVGFFCCCGPDRQQLCILGKLSCPLTIDNI